MPDVETRAAFLAENVPHLSRVERTIVAEAAHGLTCCDLKKLVKTAHQLALVETPQSENLRRKLFGGGQPTPEDLKQVLAARQPLNAELLRRLVGEAARPSSVSAEEHIYWAAHRRVPLSVEKRQQLVVRTRFGGDDHDDDDTEPSLTNADITAVAPGAHCWTRSPAALLSSSPTSSSSLAPLSSSSSSVVVIEAVHPRQPILLDDAGDLSSPLLPILSDDSIDGGSALVDLTGAHATDHTLTPPASTA